MGHISVLRAMFFWGVGALLVILGLAGMVAGQVTTGLGLFIGGFALMITNKIVFRARKVQLEIDSDEAIKRRIEKAERLEESKEE